MVFVYIRIYYAAKARARRGIRKQPRKPPNEQETKFSNSKTIPMPPGPSACKDQLKMPSNQQQQIATIEQPPKNGTTEQQVPGTSAANISIPIVTCDFASDISTSEAGAENESEYRDTLRVDGMPQDGKSKLSTLTEITSNSNNGTSGATSYIEVKNPGSSLSKKLSISPNTGRCRALSVGIDTDAVSEFEPSSSDSGVVSRCAVVKPLKFRLCQPIFGKRVSKSTNKDQHHHNHHQNNGNKKHKNHNKQKQNAVSTVATSPNSNCEVEPALPKAKVRDPEKEKRRIARKKEKRATLILGLIMGSFIACWLPFFFLYILVPACPSCKIPDTFFAIAFWLGYMNSALNPAIYTIFNKDFRRAFRRILFK
ncbi:CLUMA_CG002534, isoform A [Clunio marinus]|uniref:CLUMA_CG002534, isoform A n=1 Tax=Clunio marinus TaxID=568069 RepID=A0A1J1HLU9_9DIPT|nr:CLUMA_CG002534, isoform A [Clunio marinus]